jgi:UDP-N-acetylmuramate-alanine ligase
MYPTEESYIDAYKKLGKLVEKNKGQLYLSQNGENNEIVQREYNGKSQTYGLNHGNFTAENIEFTEEKTSFSVKKENQLVGSFETQLIGLHNIENCLAAIALTLDLGIDLEKIIEGLKTYKGVKRRMEIVGTNSKGAIIIDDFAHSAIKAQSTLEALRTRYKKNKIITIYTPRVSERESKDTLNWYQKTFENTDHVIIPKITVKKSTQKEFRIHGIDIINSINKDENSKHYFPKEEQILNFLEENSDKNTVIVFMSAGGWGDLMKKVINI